MSDEVVKVNVSVSLQGHHSFTISMPRSVFEEYREMSERDLASDIENYINWNEVEPYVDYVDEFELARDK